MLSPAAVGSAREGSRHLPGFHNPEGGGARTEGKRRDSSCARQEQASKLPLRGVSPGVQREQQEGSVARMRVARSAELRDGPLHASD